MRLQAALFFAACLSPAAAIYSDEVNHIDFHHALLGAPSADSTFFLKPSPSSNASLLYTLSDKLLVGAVNPRDGALVWRQNLSRSANSPSNAAGLLRGLDGNDALVGAAGSYISSWSAQDGRLGWENRVPGGVVADLELLELEDATTSSGLRDTVAVINSEGTGIVRRLNGNNGKTVWEYKDARFVSKIPFRSLEADGLFS
jgi:outer membrane protein assembly factor BamB